MSGQKISVSVQNHIESILVIALNKGLYLRRPNLKFTKDIQNGFKNSLNFHLEQLDKLQCSWRIQNRALNFYNDIDDQPTYESLYKKQLSDIAKEVISA